MVCHVSEKQEPQSKQNFHTYIPNSIWEKFSKPLSSYKMVKKCLWQRTFSWHASETRLSTTETSQF